MITPVTARADYFETIGPFTLPSRCSINTRAVYLKLDTKPPCARPPSPPPQTAATRDLHGGGSQLETAGRPGHSKFQVPSGLGCLQAASYSMALAVQCCGQKFGTRRNSLSNSPCRLGRAPGRPIYSARTNKPFQCSDGRDSPQRRRAAARVEQGDFFFFGKVCCLLAAQGLLFIGM